MQYTVKNLAKLSGVNISTLHYYDEIGLLKPSSRGENGYRYYEQEQLLVLQQILFFRELGFSLNDTQTILDCNDFDKLAALSSHKSTLLTNIERIQKLVNTIDKTILHLKGKITMNNEELYYGFNSDIQKSYEKYLIDNKSVDPKIIKQSRERVKHWKSSDWDKFYNDSDKLNQEFVAAIKNNLDPASKDVQNLVKRHYALIKIFWTPDKDSYIGLSQMYCEHDGFKQFYTKYHPKMVEFLTKAIEIFVQTELV